MFTKQFLRTLSILLCKAHVEICFDIYSAAHLPTQSGGILNASIIQTRPDPPSATQQCSGQQPPLRSYSRRDRTLWSLPYPQKEVKSSFLCLFLSSKDPLTAVSLRCFYMFISKPLDALFRLSLSLSHEQSRWRRHYRAGKDRHPQTTPTRMREVPKNITGRTDVRAAGYFYSL